MKKIVFIIIIIIASLSIINSVKSIYSLWQKQDVLIITKNEVEKDKKENQELKNQLKTVSNQQYVEEQARDKLFMSKQGEDTIYIPKDLLSTESAQVKILAPKPNWLQWWKLFF